MIYDDDKRPPPANYMTQFVIESEGEGGSSEEFDDTQGSYEMAMLSAGYRHSLRE
jgi:hypothetical protein